jgi:hypothetical protein
MRQAGYAKRVDQRRTHQGDITEHESGEQPSLVLRKPKARTPQTGADRSGGALPHRGSATQLRRAIGEQRSGDHVTAARQREPPGRRQRLSGQQTEPPRIECEDDDRRTVTDPA